jgi:hypothetical protein
MDKINPYFVNYLQDATLVFLIPIPIFVIRNF